MSQLDVLYWSYWIEDTACALRPRHVYLNSKTLLFKFTRTVAIDDAVGPASLVVPCVILSNAHPVRVTVHDGRLHAHGGWVAAIGATLQKMLHNVFLFLFQHIARGDIESSDA